MKFSQVADCYEKIESTAKRLEMTDYLAELLKITSNDLIDKVVYLTQGKLYPDFVDIQIGIAEKLAIQAVAKATGKRENEIREDLARTGDIGETAQEFRAKKAQATLFKGEQLTVEEVYDTLDRMARASGAGSMDKKLSLLSGLLMAATPKEARYILRIVTGTLRLGIADMTVLDALAIAHGGGKEARAQLERAYNISSDLGKVAETVVRRGLKGIEKFAVSLGKPIRPMLAERLGSPEEILEKLSGKCVVEYKYDGERVQAHKQGDRVTLFSRRLENITDQYPDASELIKKNVRAKSVIMEAECVAINADTGEMKPFQELMHRRRKYGVREAMEEHPVSLFMFDILYFNGQDLTLKPFLTRRKKLEQTVVEDRRVRASTSEFIKTVEGLEQFFERAVEAGCEGIMCKSVDKNSIYQAGARGWNWIKYKREYKSEMTDTVDLVAVGAFYGRGKRAGTYGALLLATYNPEKDVFETLSRCGTGFTDEDLERLPEIMKKHKLIHRHPKVNSMVEADVWLKPVVVMEVLGSEITLSPIHTCAMGVIRKGSGLAIRFPRFTGNYRFDRAPTGATTNEEIVKMYRNQMRKVGST